MSINDLVVSLSSLLGVGSPDGWLCMTTIEFALSKWAYLNTSLGCTHEELSVPLNNSLYDISFDLESRYTP